MQKNLLTKRECSALRGLAIIGIFLHNYCHWLGPAVKENEYQFFRMNVDGLNRALLHPDGLASGSPHLLFWSLWRAHLPLSECIRAHHEV